MDDIEFVKPKQPRNGQLIVSVSIEDLQRYKDFKQIVILYGFPYEDDKPERVGSDGASKQVKDALQNLASYDLTDQLQRNEICLLDLGDVKQGLGLQQGLKELYLWVAEIYHQLPQAVVVVIGGVSTATTYLFQSLVNGQNLKQSLTILELDKTLRNSQLFSVEEFSSANCRSVVFGIQGGSVVNNEYLKYKENGSQLYFMEKDIRRQPPQEGSDTQVGLLMKKVLEEDQNEQILVSINLEVVSSAFCPGQSVPCVVGGLTNVELLNIVEGVANTHKVKLLNLCGFNPAVESIRTKQLVAELIYTFIKQSNKQ